MTPLAKKLSLIAIIGVMRQFAKNWLTGWVLTVALLVIFASAIGGRFWIKYSTPSNQVGKP
jgi:hypothetical protein